MKPWRHTWDFDTLESLPALAPRPEPPCDMCDALPARSCEGCGLLLCDACRGSDEHREYHAAVIADQEDADART